MSLRAPTVIDQHLDLLRTAIADEKDWLYTERLRGAADGLRWMRKSGRAPTSGRHFAGSDRFNVYSEMEWAGEIETGVRALPSGMVKEYAGGVCVALAWASGDTDLPPG